MIEHTNQCYALTVHVHVYIIRSLLSKVKNTIIRCDGYIDSTLTSNVVKIKSARRMFPVISKTMSDFPKSSNSRFDSVSSPNAAGNPGVLFLKEFYLQ